MSTKTEGFLCPECMLQFESTEELTRHFESSHTNQHQIDPEGDYKSLVTDYSAKSKVLTDFSEQLSHKITLLESVIVSIVSGTLRSSDIPDLEDPLQQKIVAFLEENVKSKQCIEAKLAQVSEERDLALSGVQQLEAQLQIKESQITQLESKLERSLQDLSTKQGETNRTNRAVKAIQTETTLKSTETQQQAVDQLTVEKWLMDREAFPKERDYLATQSSALTEKNENGIDHNQIPTELFRLKEELKQHECDRQALLAMFSNATQTNASSIVSVVQSVVENLKTGKEKLQTEVEGLKQNLSELGQSSQQQQHSLEGEKSGLLAKVSALQEEVSRLGENAEAENRRIAEETARMRDATRRQEETKLELGKAVEENSALSLKITDLSNELTGSRKQISDSQIALKNLQSKHENLQRAFDGIQKDSHDKGQLIEALRSDIEKHLRDSQAKAEECSMLTQQLGGLALEKEALDLAQTKVTTDLEDANAAIALLTQSEGSLQQRLADQQEAALACQTDIQTKLDTTLLEHSTLMDRFIECQNRCTQLESTLESRHREFESLQRIVLDLGRQNQILQISQERLANRQWVADDTAPSCSSCQKEFSATFRKHHCRHCGKVFCQPCSSKRAPTPASKDPLRVCDICFAELTGVR